MHEIITNIIGGLVLMIGAAIWAFAYSTHSYLARIRGAQDEFVEKHEQEMKHLRRELRVPEPVFTTRKSPKRIGKPKVVRKTEEDEYERELPPSMSGEKTIGS